MIFTPRSMVDRLIAEDRANKGAGPLPNPQICTKILLNGYEISIAMDSSHSPVKDLTRSEIRVYQGTEDVSSQFYEPGHNMLYGDAETLYRVMQQIKDI